MERKSLLACAGEKLGNMGRRSSAGTRGRARHHGKEEVHRRERKSSPAWERAVGVGRKSLHEEELRRRGKKELADMCGEEVCWHGEE